MGDPMFSPDSGLSSNSDETRLITSSHRRKQELIVLEDVEEIDPVVVEEVLEGSDAMDRFFADSVDDYMEREEIVLSEDADSVTEFALTDRSNNCFEEFMQIGEGSARENGVEDAAGGTHDSLSKLLSDSGLQYYSPPVAGPSEEELRMMALMNTAEPEAEEQTSHFVRRSQRKRSVRLEELVDEDSEDESPPRRKGGRSKTRRPRKNWTRRPRSQPPDYRAGPSHQQHLSPMQRGPQQQFLLHQNHFPQHQSGQPQRQQQFLPQEPQQQHQFPQLQVSQQFSHQQQSQVPQHHQLPHQMPQQPRITQMQPLQVPQQQHTHQEQQHQMAPPPPPQQLPATDTVDSNGMLLSSWNSFMFNYIQKLPKDKLRYLDARLNDRLLGKLPPIQRNPGWLEELLRD